MNFYDEPPLLVSDPAQNSTDLLLERLRLAPNHEIMARLNPAGEWFGVTTREFYDEVAALAKGLIAAGIKPGQAIGILSRTRYEWAVIDFAIWFAGAVSVPIYESSAPNQIEWIMSDSDSVALFVESDEHVSRLAGIRAQMPRLTQVWKIDSPDYGNLMRSGDNVSDADLERARSQAELQDLATIIYTSGTTGNPKGCELTHRGFVDHCRNAVAELPELANDRQTSLLFLPMAHVFARFVSVICIHAGIKLGHVGDQKQVAQMLPKFQPTFLLAVPRVFEKVYNAAELKAEASGKGKIFRIAVETAITYSRSLDDPKGAGIGLKIRYRIFDKLVYGKLRAAMGGRVKFAISGGAPLGERLGHFFRGLGILVLEGYGLTETSAAAVIGRTNWVKIGKVGRALPGTGIKIAEDGEIWLRGINIMRGYWRNESGSREAFVEDWFRTGDLGTLDEDGFLTVTGRKKEMLVTAGGKNVAPTQLEDPLRAHPLIGQAVVIGDAKPFVGALISLDPEMVPVWVANNGIEEPLTLTEAANHPVILAELQKTVDRINENFSQAERIRKFAVLDRELTEASGHLTPSLKIKRARVMADFAEKVDEVYG